MTETTERSIEQILALRVRAAQMRVDHRLVALLDATDADRAEMEEAKRLADEDLALTRREALAQKRQDIEPVPYARASRFVLKRYALVLMQDDPELSFDEAMEQARLDDGRRCDDWKARYVPELLADEAALNDVEAAGK
jgi:hypothetical protein